MQKTVKEIIEMINTGELNYNQSTQRKFVYAEMPAQLEEGKTTKSGSLIHAILEEGIQLPAVYFWYNTDTNQLNIHDGKQRILSLYYFINTGAGIGITTWRNGKQTNFDGLKEEDQNRLLNYTLDIVERQGTSKEEEKSFYLINTNSVNLTSYECLSGMLHGTFLTGFENFINKLSGNMDTIKPIKRGEQAYKILLTLFGYNNTKKALSNDKSIMLLTDAISKVRFNNFDAPTYKAMEILSIYNDLSKAITKLNEDRAFAIAGYIISNYSIRANEIVALYKDSVKQINDISSWDIDTHKTFIDRFVNDGLRLDPQRNFTKEVKDILYRKSPRCAHINEDGTQCTETSYSKLEVDHIQAWSNGGRTILGNAQLLCKSHNTSKGNN